VQEQTGVAQNLASIWFSFLLQPLAFSLQDGAVGDGIAYARFLAFELKPKPAIGA
jgi:hypothetical protein